MKILDWSIIVLFLGTMTAIGMYFSRKNKNIHDYFLGGRSMPEWMVTLSVVGASISAGTFVGAPQLAYNGNLTYLLLSVGAIIGGIMAALIFIPSLYKANTITIYGYLGQRFGQGAVCASSVIFMLGVLLMAGSRLFIAAIAVSVMLYNDILLPNLVISIVILGIITTIYTMEGGIKGLIVIDAIQSLVVILTGLVCIYFIMKAIPAPVSEITDALRNSSEGNKLLLFDTSLSLEQPYNLIGALVACTIFKFAQFGTDQEFVQRSLTCRSVTKASRSLVFSQFVSLPVVLIFMVIGFLLYIFYACPEVMGATVPSEALNDSRQVFPQYMFNHLPSGLLGLLMIGLLSSALGSFNSAINAMTSSFVSDILIPLKNKKKKASVNTSGEMKQSKVMAVAMGALLTLFAVLAAFMQEAGGQTLVDFALGVMSFSYAGLLGVFLCAVFTKRGNVRSVIAALITGILVVLALQPFILPLWSEVVFGHVIELAWPWWVVIGGSISLAVCCMGKKN
jgi:SSS family transporter